MEQQFSDLIILLASGINQRRMYFDSHPRVQAISREIVDKLEPMLREGQTREFSFGVFSGRFIREGRYLVGPSIAGRSLIEFAERLGCGGFVFRLPLTPGDLVTFFRLGADQKEDVDTLETARALFAAHSLGQVELSVPLTEEKSGRDPADGDGSQDDMEYLAVDFAPLLQVYQSLYETVATNTLAISGDSRIDLDRARSHGERLVGHSDANALDVMQFMRYPDFDSYTIGHSVRVAALGAMLARELGWSRELQNEIATAGLLHDLGKGKVPEAILFKPGRLDDDERRLMETHPVLGARVLLSNGETSGIVLAAAWGHHLRQDGGGYPRMPKWFLRSPAAALVHVCDVFEALTASRPYKNPMCPRRAYEVMLADQKGYHPRMLAALIRIMGLYPPGSEVVLSDFRRAVVVARGANLEQPVVRVTHDSLGMPLPRSRQPAVCLSEEPELEVVEFLNVGVDSSADTGTERVIQHA